MNVRFIRRGGGREDREVYCQAKLVPHLPNKTMTMEPNRRRGSVRDAKVGPIDELIRRNIQFPLYEIDVPTADATTTPRAVFIISTRKVSPPPR